LTALKVIAQEFVSQLYDSQSIAPVKVVCAQRLSEEQLEKLPSSHVPPPSLTTLTSRRK